MGNPTRRLRQALCVLISLAGQSLTAAPTAAAPTAAAQRAPLAVRDGETLGFRSAAYPNRQLLEEDGILVLSAVRSATDRSAASFRVHQGFTGTGAVALESSRRPGQYWRHVGTDIILAADDGSDDFRRSASFYPRAGLSPGSDVAFEAVDQPGYFLHNYFFHAVLAPKLNTPVFYDSASFSLVRGEETYSVVLAPPAAGGFVATATVACAPWTVGCSSTVRAGAQVVIEASAFDRFLFANWIGDCAGQTAAVCTLNADHDLLVSAAFVPLAGPTHRLVAAPPSHGQITTEYFACESSGSYCTAEVQAGITRPVYAVADAGYVFAGWGGDCQGQIGSPCVLNFTGDRVVGAVFSPAPP